MYMYKYMPSSLPFPFLQVDSMHPTLPYQQDQTCQAFLLCMAQWWPEIKNRIQHKAM